MLDDTSFKSTKIKFTNKAGETVELKDVPAMFLDAGMLLYERDDYYVLCGYQVDDGPYWNWEEWFKNNHTTGAGVQLRERYRHCKMDLYNDYSGYGEPEREDYFFTGGLSSPKAKAPAAYTAEDGSMVIDVNYYAATENDDAYPSIFIGEDIVYAEELADMLPERVSGWSEDDLEHLLRMFPDQDFDSIEAFADALETIRVCKDGYDEIITISTNTFKLDKWIKEHCIQKPEWAYKWIDCYEHSGCVYSESGTGMQCRWDTSSDVGVWYLSEQLIKDIEAEMKKKIDAAKAALKPGEELDIAKFEKERDEEIDKCFRLDMAMLSDSDIAYCIVQAAYSKTTLESCGVDTEECAIYEGITFPYGDADKYLVQQEGSDHIPYEILEEETKNPWP